VTAIDYLLLGHMTADLTPHGRTPGGTVSYAAQVAHTLGRRVGIVTSTAAGETLLATLAQYAALSVRVADHTTTFENIYRGTERIQYCHSTATYLTWDDIPAGWLNAPFVHLGPIAAEVDPRLIHRLPPETLVLLTPQGWMRHMDADGRVHFKRFYDEDVLRRADVVVFSRQDIVAAPELEPEFAALVKHLFVTDGASGGTYYHQGVPQPYAAYPVTEVEPTGAGDVFATTLLACLPQVGHDMGRAIRVAARLAAACVTRAGIENSVTPAEVQSALDMVKDG
jgi:sugar/nucleoside kinase (ribokinase family)